ncbi:hypothetical protein PGB90_003363 [Kerria lacca]
MEPSAPRQKEMSKKRGCVERDERVISPSKKRGTPQEVDILMPMLQGILPPPRTIVQALWYRYFGSVLAGLVCVDKYGRVNEKHIRIARSERRYDVTEEDADDHEPQQTKTGNN